MAARPMVRVSGVKAAIAVVAILCAALSLAILQTASPVADARSGADRSDGAPSPENGNLGR